MSSSAIHGIDLFAGAGGLSIGAQLAGIRITYAVENNKAAAATYRHNHPDTTVMEKDVRDLVHLPTKRGAPLVLFGGPPCQGFSTSNQRTRTIANPQNWLFSEFFRLARQMRPDLIVLENVGGLRGTQKGYFDRLIATELGSLCSDVGMWSLSAADFGVPQKRSRIFYVGRSKGELPPAPHPVSGRPITVREAILDLPKLRSGATEDIGQYRPNLSPSAYALKLRRRLRECSGHLVSANNPLVLERYRHIPPGGNWCNIPRRLMQNYHGLIDKRSRHTGIYRRLKWNEPSVVIANYRKNMLIHPEQHRGLSVREAARLQSFPDSYRFLGSIGLQQQQVSNAVPPLLARAVFQQLLDHL